jgi:16S rRNA processing protein RimM
VYVNGERRKVLRARDNRGAWILQVEGLSSRTVAEALRGTLIEALDADVRRTDEESFFVHELIGLEVVTSEGEPLGKLVDVLQPGSNDVYVVHGVRGELLVPAIASVVLAIDPGAGVMTITPLARWLDEAK